MTITKRTPTIAERAAGMRAEELAELAERGDAERKAVEYEVEVGLPKD